MVDRNALEGSPKAERHFTFLWVPAIIVGVLVFGAVTFRTTFQIEKLRQQSVVEATLSLANEKVDRLDKRIVEEDNDVLAVANVASLTSAPRSWPTSARKTPTVRAILILDPQSPSHDVLAFASRTEGGGGPEDDAGGSTFVKWRTPLSSVYEYMFAAAGRARAIRERAMTRAVSGRMVVFRRAAQFIVRPLDLQKTGRRVIESIRSSSGRH